MDASGEPGDSERAMARDEHTAQGGTGGPAGQQPADVPERKTVLTAVRAMMVDRTAANIRSFYAERQFLVWALAFVIGLAVAYAAILFRVAIAGVQGPWLGVLSENVAEAAKALPWWTILLAPAVGGLIVGLILQNLMPGRRALGVADVIEARAMQGSHIPVYTGLTTALVSAVSLGSGASAGREGPVVHLGATLASGLCSKFELPRGARRTLLACGVAAAVSASFNAPLAGFLFAHEVILQHYALRAFVPIAISSVVATVIARVHLGDYPAFIIPAHEITSYLEFPAFALLGLTCAIVAIAFQFAVVGTDRVALQIRMPLWLRPVVGGLMVGAIAIVFPEVLGVGYDTTDAALKQELPLAMLFMLLFAKTAAVAITLASRFGGGVFSPSLYLGAMTGGAFGLIAAGVFPELASAHGLYAIVGMGAVAAAVLGAPVSTILIVFELTGDYQVSIASLLAVSISCGLTQAVHGVSFFHWQLGMRGLFLDAGPHQGIVRSLLVRDFMVRLDPEESPRPIPEGSDIPFLSSDDTVEAALRLFNATGHHRIAVVEANNPTVVIGWANHIDALNAFNHALIEAQIETHK